MDVPPTRNHRENLTFRTTSIRLEAKPKMISSTPFERHLRSGTTKTDQQAGWSTPAYTPRKRVSATLMGPVETRHKQFATQEPRLLAPDCTSQAAVGFHSLSPHRFQARLTLFPKCFPPFPHGTCSLSYSGRYLARDGTYHRISAPVPRNATLWNFNRTQSTKLR